MGAATGLVVAGFNHVVHKMEEDIIKSKLEKDMEAKKMDPNSIPDVSCESIEEVLTLDTNQRLLNKVNEKGNYHYQVANFPGGNSEVLEGQTTAAVTVGDYTLYYSNAFASNLHLALNVYHELGHSYIWLYYRAMMPANSQAQRNRYDEYLIYSMEIRYHATDNAVKNRQFFLNYLENTGSYNTKIIKSIESKMISDGF